MDLLNTMLHSIDSHLVLKVGVILCSFSRMLVHRNGNVSLNIHFWIFAGGGNKHPCTRVSLPAEVGSPAKIGVEQEKKIYFVKMAGFGMFYALYISSCKNDIQCPKCIFFWFRT